ncbi:MAG: UDP-N-acetylglucosamine 2-epimerase [Gemmiger formicilis]|uniref:UDP-N-acetylglucosamine 2-epimerase n=1 Tax=Gemmiger formicilis TaxID=745368 RepID=UPI0039A2FF5A
MRTITVVTATRAEYGLLRPVVQKIAASDVLDLQLVVTGAHLCPRLGETVHEIEADGLPIAARLPIFTDNADEPVAKTIARTMEIFDNHFAAHRPDAVLLLGDRFEIFAVAAAAAARHIPIAHISGGDVTLGRGGRILPPLHQQNGDGTLSVLRRQRRAACADGRSARHRVLRRRAGG